MLGILISSVANAQLLEWPVTPKQFFPSNILNVHAPDSEGWVINGVGRNGIAFSKRGAESSETYAAHVVIFEMPSTTSGEELVSFVKKHIAVVNPPPRYRETNSNYQYIENRGYPCVNVHIDFDDTAAITPTSKEQLKLQVVALYCRHPKQRQLGFFAAYSHRGKTTYDQIENSAKSFIESIDIPEKELQP